jgi:hypothetical protein
MSGLFDNDEAYMQAAVRKVRTFVRNSAGRFCTEEERENERIRRENAVLRHKVEMYRRNWFSVSDRASRLDRENHRLKELLKKYGKD